MTLYSTDILSNANQGQSHAKSFNTSGVEVENLPQCKEDAPWYYLFTHRAHVGKVNEKLQERFRTFIRKMIAYSRQGKRIQKEERPSISGLIFVQCESYAEVQDFLDEHY